MIENQLKTMSISELLDGFAECCVQQDIALLGKGTAWFRRYYERMDKIRNELKRRDGDQRRTLLTLFDHPNMQVRVQAAKAALAVAPVEARQQLKEIATSKWFPQAGDAGMSLWNLERGFFKPT